MLKSIFLLGRGRPDRHVGYVYVADGKDGPMCQAKAGQIVAVDGPGPPWIVVDEAPTTAIVARWPGKLWKVRIVKAAAKKDQPLAYARYTRALSVEVLDEENSASLFGPSGAEVVSILQQVTNLNREKAEFLSANRHSDAPSAYDRTFRRWAEVEGLETGYYDNLDGVLRVGSMPHGSPIYEGLSVLHTLVFHTAKTIDGGVATTVEDEEEYLNEPWEGGRCGSG